MSFNLRIVGLTILDNLGLHWFQSLPVLLLAGPEGKEGLSPTTVYSYRLQTNFRPHLRWRPDVRGVCRPMIVIIGADDELFQADAYKKHLEALNRNVRVRILPRVTHLSILNDPATRSVVCQSFFTEGCENGLDAVQA